MGEMEMSGADGQKLFPRNRSSSVVGKYFRCSTRDVFIVVLTSLTLFGLCLTLIITLRESYSMLVIPNDYY